MSERPSVSVIVPFAGSDEQLAALIRRLAAIELGPGDEVLVADNRPWARCSGSDAAVRLVAAAGVRAPAFARNRAARLARGEWLVLIDADTDPLPGLVARYFEPVPGPRVGVLAGAIVDRAGGLGLVARVSAGRGQMSQETTLSRRGSPYAQTANCALRRAAFEAVGGFDEGARCGEDADLCFRLAAAGWELEPRPGAVVEHPARATLAALLMQLARHGSGAAWLNRRYPGEFAPPRARDLAGRLGRAGVTAAAASWRGDRRAAGASLVEIASASAFELGRLLSNRPPGG